MSTLKNSILIAIFVFAAAGFVTAQSFTYQGKLTVSGTPANGAYDFRFRMFDADTGGTQQGAEAGQSYLVDGRQKGFQFEPRFISVVDEITDLDLIIFE